MQELNAYGEDTDDEESLVVMTAGGESSSMPVPLPVPMCAMCQIRPRQYKCPRCDVLTCSLDCCKRHKIESQCTGRRDRTAFVGIQNFDENHLRSDFHFLEDVLQTKDSATRTLHRNYGKYGQRLCTNALS
jgi:hypothetical protein